jgi:hypothetical protein
MKYVKTFEELNIAGLKIRSNKAIKNEDNFKILLHRLKDNGYNFLKETSTLYGRPNINIYNNPQLSMKLSDGWIDVKLIPDFLKNNCIIILTKQGEVESPDVYRYKKARNLEKTTLDIDHDFVKSVTNILDSYKSKESKD